MTRALTVALSLTLGAALLLTADQLVTPLGALAWTMLGATAGFSLSGSV